MSLLGADGPQRSCGCYNLPVSTAWTCALDDVVHAFLIRMCLFQCCSLLLQSYYKSPSKKKKKTKKNPCYRNHFTIHSMCFFAGNSSSLQIADRLFDLSLPAGLTDSCPGKADVYFLPSEYIAVQNLHLCKSSLKPTAVTGISELICKPCIALCREFA